MPLRAFPSLKRSVEECARVRGVSVSDEAGILMLAALPAERRHLGLGEGDPLEVTSARLDDHLEIWRGEFTGAELAAATTLQRALKRLAEKRDRETG
jgi:hypothetical protein